MAKFLLPFLLLVINQQFFCNCDFTFTSVAPLNIFPREPYQISTTLEKVDHPPVAFKYDLVSQQNSKVFAFSKEFQMRVAGHEITSLIVSPKSLPEEMYDLVLTATDAIGTKQTDKISVTKKTRKSAILIQTDKPIYKPGGIVKFRVFFLTGLLRPFQDDKTADIIVFDPMGNVIKYWKSKEVSKTRGFVSDEFELSKEPVLGDWKIEVKVDNGTKKEQHPFSVEEYVLPKYKVEINPSPSFVTYNNSKFTAEVSAMYSYGKPVSGECTVELSNINNDFYYWVRRTPTRTISKTSRLEEGKGLAKIEFDVKSELNINQLHGRMGENSFQLFASCTDQASGNVRNATEIIKMYEFAHKLELVEKPNSVIPGFPVHITLKVATQDDLPVSDERRDALKIDIGSTTIYKSIPANGLVPVTFTADKDSRHVLSITVTYKLAKETYRLSNSHSQTGNYVQLNLLTESPAEGQPIAVNVRTSKEYQVLNLVLVDRGQIIHSETHNLGGDKEQAIKVSLPQSPPKVKLFAYLVCTDLSIISDALDLNVKPKGINALEVSMSDTSVQPGANVSISVKGKPNSIVGLRAVDQSVLLLKQDEDLTSQKLENARKQSNLDFGMTPWFSNWHYDSMNKGFVRNGIGLMTSTQIKDAKKRRMEDEHRRRMDDELRRWQASMTNYRGSSGTSHQEVHFSLASPGLEPAALPSPPPARADSPFFASIPNPTTPIPARVRSIFPETWIWEDIDNPLGQLDIQKQVPDTITSWHISAFQIDREQGLSLAQETQKLTVFQPFFIALNLPYSVVKGEVLFLQVLVHNYQEETVTVDVTLENQENSFKFLEVENEIPDRMVKQVVVNASSISSVIFPIAPTKFGIITLSARATAISSSHSASGDAVRRTLIVRPPGIKHTQNSAVLINLMKNSVFRKEKISAIFPDQRVPDADFLKVQVVGDVLGGSIENLDELIKLPTGCGEQNMVHFVPDIVILDYLISTGQLSPEVETRAKRYLEKGYQRQLTYLRPDGSYSVFGKRDRVGSTWLTAFVTRAFIQAKRYISIDDEVIKKSLRFLLTKQNSNGSFTEDGFVMDKSLQGGAGKESSKHLTITAYTLLAIVEAQKADINLQSLSSSKRTAEEIIMSGVNFLVEQTSEDESFNDVYSANLMSYLLQTIRCCLLSSAKNSAVRQPDYQHNN